MVNLLKSSRSESSNNNKQPDANLNNHVVSSIHKLSNTLTLPSIWVLDSGASDHVCPHLHSFINLFKIKPISVCFPNSSNLLAYYCGTIQFSYQVTIHNVLFLPQFYLNLMSNSQLIKQLNCQLTFSPDSCYI